jgi:hypothetical protein
VELLQRITRTDVLRILKIFAGVRFRGERRRCAVCHTILSPWSTYKDAAGLLCLDCLERRGLQARGVRLAGSIIGERRKVVNRRGPNLLKSGSGTTLFSGFWRGAWEVNGQFGGKPSFRVWYSDCYLYKCSSGRITEGL